ncbi:MAG: APC family permease, partial [Acetobacter papayae]
VLVGVVPWRGLGVADPLAVAVGVMGQPWLALCIKLGAVIGLCSVLLGLLYAQSRIFYTMAEDGLLSALFRRLHPRFLTPWHGTLVLGVGVALATAVLPVEMIGDLVSLGTAMAFGVVCLTVIWLRNVEPDMPRVFLVPLGGFWIRGIWIGYVPLLGVLFCLVMIAPLGADMALALWQGNPLPVALLVGYALAGWAFYRFYGRHHSRMGQAESGP